MSLTMPEYTLLFEYNHESRFPLEFINSKSHAENDDCENDKNTEESNIEKTLFTTKTPNMALHPST
jgi:hypothetical protein